MNKTAKVLYYTDTKDNTKSPFLVTDGEQDLRNLSIIEKIGEQLEAIGFGKKGICNSVAYELAYHESAELLCQMGSYEFGVEEVPMLIGLE